ncbi:MAG: thioredoxin family protein [Actinomycetes bacterium]
MTLPGGRPGPDGESPSPAQVSRRAFLGRAAGAAGVTAGAWLLAGAVPVGAALDAKGAPLSVLVLSSDLAASPDPQRFVFAIARGAKYDSTAPAQVGFAAPGATRATVAPTQLLKEGLPRGRGIYVIEATFPTTGVYQSVVVTRGKRIPFSVQVKSVAEAPRIGTAAPRAPSPTPAAPLGVDPICTRTPPCPLHTASLSDLVGSGRKVAVIFATPALCQSQYCGPVLDEVLSVMGKYQDRVSFVHVDIYTSNKGATLSPTVQAWGLPSEPWIYTIDGDGTIVGRLDGAISKPEITALLDHLVA